LILDIEATSLEVEHTIQRDYLFAIIHGNITFHEFYNFTSPADLIVIFASLGADYIIWGVGLILIYAMDNASADSSQSRLVREK
jgi:hypothetical protein